jgi:Xaa-Pro aminopeptidase
VGEASGKDLWELCSISVPELRQERYERLYNMMDAEEVDAFVVLASATLGRKGNLRYVTNYSPVSRYAGIVFPRYGDPVLFVPYAVHVAWAENITWVEDVRFSDDFSRDMAALLRDRGLATGHIGLVGEDTIVGFEQTLSDRLSEAAITSLAGPFAQLRMLKGPLEITLARHAASMADQVFTEAAILIADGATEAEIFAAGEARLRRLNSEECLLLIDTVGGQVMPLPSQRAVGPGDLVQYSVEPVSPGGHWIQSIRMFGRHTPGPLARRVVGLFTDALTAAQATLAPGVPISEVANVIAEVLAPIASHQGKPPYGHGIGMDNFEPPLLSVRSDVMVEANMMVVIHPALTVEGRNFYLGDTYLVTDTGAERLSKYPLDLAVV